jgi:hypothetical protein
MRRKDMGESKSVATLLRREREGKERTFSITFEENF